MMMYLIATLVQVMRQEPPAFSSDAFYSDVFSYGMILWELLNHKQPFSEIPTAQGVREEVLQRKVDSTF